MALWLCSLPTGHHRCHCVSVLFPAYSPPRFPVPTLLPSFLPSLTFLSPSPFFLYSSPRVLVPAARQVFNGGTVPALQFPKLTKVTGDVLVRAENGGEVSNIKFNTLSTVSGSIKIHATTSSAIVGNALFPALTLVRGSVLLGASAGTHNGRVYSFSANTDTGAASLEVGVTFSVKTASSTGSVGSVHIGAMHSIGRLGDGTDYAFDVYSSAAAVGAMTINQR